MENAQPEKEVETVDGKVKVEVPPKLEEKTDGEPVETNEMDTDCAAKAFDSELEHAGAAALGPELEDEDIGEAELDALIPEIQMDTSDPQVDP